MQKERVGRRVLLSNLKHYNRKGGLRGKAEKEDASREEGCNSQSQIPSLNRRDNIYLFYGESDHVTTRD